MSIASFGKKLAASAQALTLVFGLAVTSLASVSVAVPAPTYAVAAGAGCTANPGASSNPLSDGAACSKADGTATDLFGSNGIFKTIANTAIYIIGAIAVLFLILGGLRYVTSNGDPKNVTAAKDTILYAIIGIIVAILSFAVVNFVIGSLTA